MYTIDCAGKAVLVLGVKAAFKRPQSEVPAAYSRIRPR
jgi:hypothetical protein